MNRRHFMKKAGSALAGAALFPTILPSRVTAASQQIKPSDKIVIASIGVGKQGGGLLRGFLYKPECHVVAVCDVDRLKREAAQKAVQDHYYEKFGGDYKGCDATMDFREIIERTDIDAVVIATPDHWHALPSIMATQAGKDIYCEKPLTLTINEGREMIKAVRSYSRVFQTGSMQRSSSQFRQACELVRNGYIGDVKHVRVSIRTGFENHPIECNLPPEPVPEELDWDMWQGQAPERPYNSELAPPISFDGWPAWRNYRAYSGGGMTDWGAHHFDIAQWGLGMDNSGPVEIFPPDGKDVKELTYRYANGVEMATDFNDNRILFTGTEGTVEVNRNHIKTNPKSLLSVKLKPSDVHLYKSSDHKQNFIDCIHQRTKPITDVETGHRSVTVCHLGNLAVQLGRPLQWDPEKEEFIGDDEANRLRSRHKREPWSLP